MNLEKKERNNSALLLEELLLLHFCCRDNPESSESSENLETLVWCHWHPISPSEKSPRYGPGDELVLITLHLSRCKPFTRSMPCKILQRFGGCKPSWYSRIGSRENPPESLVIWRKCVKSRVSSMFPLKQSVLSWILVGLPLSHYNPHITPAGTDEAPPFRTSFWWCFGPARVHQIDPGRAAVSHVI